MKSVACSGKVDLGSIKKRILCRQVITHITFHGVGPLKTAICAEERDMWLNTIQFKEVLNTMQGRADVYVTVDDGNASDMEIVAPALKEREMKGTFFVPVGLLGLNGYMSKADVRQLADMGFVVGSHGIKHVNWRKLSNSNLKSELYDSRRILEQMIGRKVDQAACPFGSYDRRVLRCLKKAGYNRVYTSDRGISQHDAWLQARNTIRACDDVASVRRMLSKGLLSADFLMCRVKTAVKRVR